MIFLVDTQWQGYRRNVTGVLMSRKGEGCSVSALILQLFITCIAGDSEIVYIVNFVRIAIGILLIR